MNMKIIVGLGLIIFVIIFIVLYLVFTKSNFFPANILPANIWIGNWADSSNPAANMQFKQERSIMTLANTAANQYNIPHKITGNTITFYGLKGTNNGKIIDWHNGIIWTKKNF